MTDEKLDTTSPNPKSKLPYAKPKLVRLDPHIVTSGKTITFSAEFYSAGISYGPS